MLVTDKSKAQDFYNALINRKSDYIGVFFVGVKTTSIFCIATCTARKPKFENVEFYTEMKDALDHGYRPCKVCKPTQNANEAPEYVRKAMKIMKANPKIKIKNQQLRENGISPDSLRRWFNKNYGLTFHAYQRMYRINMAYNEIKSGHNTTGAAFDNGYDSLSGFGYTFKKIIGKSPRNSVSENVIIVSRTTTPLGPMFVGATEKGLCLLEFVDRKMLETEFGDLQKHLNARIIIGENKHTQKAKRELQEYFKGERKDFTLPLDTPGTEFQKEVWRNLTLIPYGNTTSYQAQASLLKNPAAIRAMATANGFNRVAIIIPCHRVIGKDGQLRGYGGGVERKKWLINFEKSNLNTTY